MAGGKFILEIDLRQPQVKYSACGLFTENKQRIQTFQETRDSRYIYQNKLDKAHFQHDMAYGDFKDLPFKAFNTAKNLRYDRYQRGLTSMVH